LLACSLSSSGSTLPFSHVPHFLSTTVAHTPIYSLCNFFPISPYTSARSAAFAATIPDNGGVYFVPAFSGLYAPYWRSDARGLIAGLTLYNTKAHIVRAALEAAAFQVTEVVDAMEKDAAEAQLGLAVKHTLKLLVDGGMTNNATLMQFQSDMLGISIQRPRSAETSALGAAFAAGLGVQYWTSLEQLKSVYTAGQVWHPQAPPAERIRQLHNWKKAISRSLGWIEGPAQH
jgi:glycerol kinase